tara:strand:+ start:1096 stop:2451 length:1356 start_codon:yes stop_codon:yes gene_type:complete
MSKISQRLELNQRLNPKQILEASIVQLNVYNLEKRILEEIEKNPALEIDDDLNNNESDDSENLDDFSFEELVSNPEEYEFSQTNKKNSFSDSIKDVYADNLFDDIMDQLNELNSTDDEIKVAEQILGNLDKNGFLPIEPILISDRLGYDESFVIDVKNKIQTLDPPGLGSLSIQDCIISQLKKYHPKDNFSSEIIRNFFEDFSNHKYDKIAKKLKCSKEKIYKTAELVSVLNPSPAINYQISNVDHIIPDIVVEYVDDKWSVQINEPNVPNIKISKQYVSILDKYSNDSDVKTFVKQKLNNAQWFIDAINQRNNTIKNVMHSIIKHQKSYFNFDKRVLSPMILKNVAEDIGMDISTISRVCNAKYAQMPWGVKELKSFFSEGIKMKSGDVVSSEVVKQSLRDIISQEDKNKPYNDERLTEKLNDIGYIIARRTVTKYRESIKIAISRLRKV